MLASLAGLRAAAQEDDAAAASEPAATEPSPAAAAPLAVPAAATDPAPPAADGPDVFLLPDETGRLRRVLGYRYEDFFRAWQADGAADSGGGPPSAVLSSFEVDVTADADGAKLTATAEIELRSDQWVKAPLELGSLIVERSTIEGGGNRDFIMVDAARGGYVAWLKGQPGERRRIVLVGASPVAASGTGSHLELVLPTAAKSVVTLSTPAAAKVDAPAQALVAAEVDPEGRFRSRIDGVKGPLSVSWGQASSELPPAAAIDAVVDAVISVEPGRLAYEALITLRGVSSPIERIRIKLPPGATASEVKASAGYEVTAVPGEEPAAVEVRFFEPSQAPPVVRLAADERGDPAEGAILRAGAWQVVGAFRQRGQVAVRVSDQLHAHFERSGRITQIEPADLPSTLLAEPPLAAFETTGADWTVEIHTQPRQRKVSVTPTYELNLGSHGALLEASLDYQITGGRLFELRVNLHGWELSEQPIESGGLVDPAEQHVTPEGILIMPLKDSDLPQTRVRFTLRREAGLGVHELPLPEALDAFALPGELTVTYDDAWRVTAQIEKSTGVSLAPDAAIRAAPMPPTAGSRPAAPQALRLQTFLPQARLAIDVSEREQQIVVKSNVEVRVAEQSLTARQVLDFEVLHQPASELSVIVSAELLANEGLKLLLGGESLASTAVDVQTAAPSPTGDEDGDLRLVVRLPQPLVGRARLEIMSGQQLSAAQRSGDAAIVLPLALPDQAASTATLVASAGAGRRVLLRNVVGVSPWLLTPAAKAESTAPAADAAILRAAASRPPKTLALVLEPSAAAPPTETRLESAWAQTWVAGGMRQDRFVYRFTTSAAQAVVNVPAGFGEFEVLLDQQPVPADRSRPGVVAVELSSGEPRQPLTLELRRHTPLRIGTWGRQTVSFPRLEGADDWSPFFWQLILPPELSTIGSPEGMSAEYQLGWQGLRWGREPTQSQRDLERWTAAANAPPPSPRSNQYLYSAFHAPLQVEFLAVRRIWIVVAAGLGALAIGLASLYTGLVRSAGFWLAVCIAAGGVLFVYPEIAVLMVQAILLGGAFTLVSLVSQWLLAGARPARTVASPAASSIASLATTQPWIAEHRGGSDASATSGTAFQTSGSPS